MSRPKSLAEQQQDFKRNLLSQAKNLQNISEARSAQSTTAKSHAYDYLTASATIGDRHLNSYLFSIISFLKEKDRAVSLDEVKQYLRIDLASFPELLASVSDNERIICNLPYLEYRPLYNIRTKQELLDHLRKNAVERGFDINCIREVFPKVNSTIQELTVSKQILGFGPKEDIINIVFYNDLTLPVYPDADIKKLWHGQIVPDEHDLQLQLERAGLKGMEVTQEKPKAMGAGVKRPSSNRNRRIKMTNVHLTDFDFSQDYIDQK